MCKATDTKNENRNGPSGIYAEKAENVPSTQNEPDKGNSYNPKHSRQYRVGNDGWVNINKPDDLSIFTGDLPIKVLTINQGSFFDLTPLSTLKNLEKLSIWYSPNVRDITPITSLSKLEELEIVACENIETLGPILLLPNLKNLHLGGEYLDYSIFENLHGLESLRITSFAGKMDIAYISGQISLKRLRIGSYPYSDRIINISDLQYLTNLENLTIENTGIIDFYWITNLEKLEYLQMTNCEIVDARPLVQLPNLKIVTFSSSYVSDILVLTESKSIKTVLHGPDEYPRQVYEAFEKMGIGFWPASDR
jgi:hypothetical protein